MLLVVHRRWRSGWPCPDEAQEAFTSLQKATVIGMVLVAFVVGHALARCRVDADDDGLTVVNGYRTPPPRLAAGGRGDAAARAARGRCSTSADGTTRSAMGIQGSDGGRAVRQTRQLRALVDAHAASEPRG